MKAILILLLAALLTGCTQPTPPTEPGVTSAPTTEPTQPPQTLVAGAMGDLTYFDAPDLGCAAFAPMAEGYALLTTDGTALILKGEDLTVEKSRSLGCPLRPDDPSIFITDDQLSYYDSVRKGYVTLGKNLTEVSFVTIRDAVTASPIMSADRATVYYCTETGLRALDMATGNARMLRQEHHTIVSLDALLFDGSILRYTYETETGGTEVCFVRTSDGTGVYLADLNGEIVTWGDNYAAAMHLHQPMGVERQIVTGSVSGEVQMLKVADTWTNVIFVDGSALLQTQKGGELLLELYDLRTGSRTASIHLNTQSPVTGALPEEKGLWLWSGEISRFFFWSFEKTQTESFLVAQPTFSNPDTAAIDAARQQVEKLSGDYRVPFTIVQGENRTSGVDYSGYPDCRAAQYEKAAAELAEAVSRVPYNVLSYLYDAQSLRVELVDDFDPAHGVQPGTGSVEIGDQVVIRVSICQELQEIFYHELFHAMDVYIHSRHDKLTEWDDVNPDGFVYSGSYVAYQRGELNESPFAEAFPDAYARISAREDRAQTFMYAMLAGHGEKFQSDEMQKKLQILDEAIRKTFGYRDSTETFTWQQYRK